MTPATLLNYLEQFVIRWGGTTMPRILVAFAGLMICVGLLIALWERRIRVFSLVMGLLLGLFLILAAVNPKILQYLVGTSFIARIRFLMVVLSFLVVVITLEAIRRSHLQERYAILWVTTGLLILLAAFFPQVLNLFTIFLGTQYVTSVVGIVFVFLLLIVFHFSIALSGIQKRQYQIAQRCALLEIRVHELAADIAEMKKQTDGGKENIFPEPSEIAPANPIDPKNVAQPHADSSLTRGFLNWHDGITLASYGIILTAFLSVLIVGIYTPQAMIGDEVTHYYMLTTQAENLSRPNFFARIPTGWGEVEQRCYPHSCFWHYGGALLYRLTGGSFFAVQLYQSFFWLQFLVVAYLLARSLLGRQARAVVIYMLVLATLPVCLVFSVAFYQDIPMAAQALTAFYLLHRRRWFWATLFMSLTVAMKISALLFIPPFLLCLAVWEYRGRHAARMILALCVSTAVLGFFLWGISWSLKQYAQAGFYPVEQIHKAYAKIQRAFAPEQTVSVDVPSSKEKGKVVTPYEVEIIANHPGDLRIPENFIVYGGGILWFVLFVGGLSIGINKIRRRSQDESFEYPWWFLGVGVWFMILTAFLLRTAPDARFFLPGIPFILLPFAEGFSRLPRFKIFLCVIAALAILQGGQVLKKTYDLRHLSADLREGIAFLQTTPLTPPHIFMYPEGNYRFFPYRHEWYLNYQLREFWKGDNDTRITMLKQFRIGAVVIKKHLIADVDDAITNLGVYPIYFVRDVERDRRFLKLFENNDVIIFKTP
jgi:hypothetical protein